MSLIRPVGPIFHDIIVFYSNFPYYCIILLVFDIYSKRKYE